MGNPLLHRQPCADKGAKMTAAWIAYIIIGVGVSVYGFYLMTRKHS